MEWQNYDDIHRQLLARRGFVSTLLSGLASFYALPTALNYIWGNGKLLHAEYWLGGCSDGSNG